MPERDDARLEEILATANEALSLLDTCIGQSTRLQKQNRLVVREHLLEPRNHLRDRLTALQCKTEEIHPSGRNPAVSK